MRLRIFSALCVALWLACAAPAAEDAAPWNLERVQQEFSSTNAVAGHVCLVHDGWNIALLSHNKSDIAAIFISDSTGSHEYNLRDTARRLAKLIHLESPLYQELEEAENETAIVLNSHEMDSLANDSERALGDTPLAGMAYLLQEGYFYITDLTGDGYLRWKTVKKSNVELLMPMAPARLQAIEVTGRQRMDEFASEVLARKLGFGSNTAMAGDRMALAQQQRLDDVPYMNTKAGVITARRGKRVVFGKRNAVLHMLANRYGGTLLYPAQPCDWPEKKKEEPAPQPVVEEVAPPLTPQEARETYTDYLRSLSK